MIMPMSIPAAWYVDPDSSDRQRYFDDAGWSPWVSSRQGMTLSPLADPSTPPPSGVAVTREILRQAQADGVIDSRTLGVLLRYTERWSAPAASTATPARSTATAADRAWEPDSALWSRSATPTTPASLAAGVARSVPTAAFPAELAPRSPLTRWWHETRETVKSDLAVHGLAYLGVLLLFAGVFGLVVWSFSDINRAMRPVAELAIPGALFAGAVMLNRRGTRVVAGALEVAGGLLLPIVAVASFVDDAPLPPDPTGVGLTVSLAVTTLAIAVGYALWVRRHPTSTLAYLVAPVAWLAAGFLSLSWLDPVPAGESVAQPRAIETAVMAIAAGLTLLVCRLRPQLPLANATLTSGPIALVVLGLLALLAGSTDGWPTTPAVLTAVGIATGLEALDRRLPGPTLAIATSLTVGLGLLAARSGLDTSPWVTALAFAAATGWAEYHRRRTTGGERQAFVAAASLFPVGVAVGTVAALWWPNGLILVSLLLVATAVLLRVLQEDSFWSTWSAAASGVVALTLAIASTVQVLWPASADTAELEGSWQAPVTALLLAAAIGTARTRHAGVATWAAVAVVAEAWALAVPALELSDDLVAVGWAVGAAVIVVSAASLPRGWRVPTTDLVLGHLTLSSLGLGVVAAVVAGAEDPWSSSRMALVTGAAAVAWLYVSVAEELGGNAAVTLARQWSAGLSADVVRSSPAAVAALAVAGTVAFAVDASDVITDDAWWPVVAGATAAVYATVARFTVAGLPRNSRIAHEASLFLAVAALVLGIGQGEGAATLAASAATFALVIAVAVIVPRRWRDSRPAWLGWAASAALTVVSVDRMGADRDQWPMTLMVWGSVVVLAALSVERLSAAAPLRPLVQRTLPPVALGTLGLGLGAVTVAGTEDFATTGWWFLLVTATAAVAGLITRDGRLFGLAATTVTVSYAALAPWDPVERPWTIVALGAIWLAAADIVRRWPVARATPQLSASLFWVGQLVVVAALPLVVVEDQRPLGLALTGLVSIGIAVRIPAPGARPWYAAGGASLILLGAADESLGWLTVAWVVLSVGTTAAAAFGRGLSDRAIATLRGMGTATGFAAWVTFTRWADWTDETSVIVTAVGAGLLLAALGVTVQLVPAGRAWAEAWGTVALLALILSTLGLLLPDVPRTPAGQLVSTGLALAAVAAALAAEPLGRHWLRTTTVLVASTAAATFLYGIGADTRDVVAVAVALAVASTIGVAMVAGTGRGAAWRPALLVAATLTAGAALTAAATELPDRTLLVGALVVVAAQCVVIGRVVGLTVLLVSGPPLLSLSWILYASEALSGNPQWYLVPVGLALVVMAALLRWTRRRADKDMATTDVVALELAGVGFIAGAALVQTVTDSLGYAVLAIAEGVAIAFWGAVTKVRRRLAAGAGVVVAAVVLLIAVPLLPLLPEWRGAALWVAVAGLGLAAIIIATFIERGRAKVGAWVKSLSETMNDWE
jgi:hypothetical protein